MTFRNRNELWGRVLIDELARSGVGHIVVAPGSRSAPLVLAAATDSRLRISTQIDERSAGFLALGAGKATGRPAAVITTSGTAVANLMPAVVEAAQGETPLILLTADRPPRLRGADANQTIEQRSIFGGYVRFFEELFPGDLSDAVLRGLRSVVCRSVAHALGEPAGPVHLNVPLDLPLEPVPVEGDLGPRLADGTAPGAAGRPAGRPWTRVRERRSGVAPEALGRLLATLRTARAPLLVGGVVSRPWEVGPRLVEASRATGIPLLADPLSGARYPGRAEAPPPAGLVGGYDLALASSRIRGALAPDLIIRVGLAPVSKALAGWLESMEGVATLIVSGAGRWRDHAGLATEWIAADPARLLAALAEAGGGDPPRGGPWLEAWRALESDIRAGVRGLAADPPFEALAVSRIVDRIPEEALLFVSNSMPVRDVDTFVPHRSAGLTVLGNRGASGIDGVVSTAAGIALASGRQVVAVVGDLALLHDSNGLASLRAPGVRVLLVVLNNDGGGIFHHLPIRSYEPAFTPLFVTPHGLDLGHLAALHRLRHVRVDLRPSREGRASAASLGEAWSEALAGGESAILEIRTDREANSDRRAAAVGKVASGTRVPVGAGERAGAATTRRRGG